MSSPTDTRTDARSVAPTDCMDCRGVGCRHCLWVVFAWPDGCYFDRFLAADGSATDRATDAATFRTFRAAADAARTFTAGRTHVGRVDDLAPWDLVLWMQSEGEI